MNDESILYPVIIHSMDLFFFQNKKKNWQSWHSSSLSDAPFVVDLNTPYSMCDLEDIV